MANNNKKKSEQLGMPHGTASGRLRKMILFHLLKKLGDNVCFQCKGSIESIEDLSIEHKIPWLDSSDPPALFFDLENIAFSHLSCNVTARNIQRKYLTTDDKANAKRVQNRESKRRRYSKEKRREKFRKHGY